MASNKTLAAVFSGLAAAGALVASAIYFKPATETVAAPAAQSATTATVPAVDVVAATQAALKAPAQAKPAPKPAAKVATKPQASTVAQAAPVAPPVVVKKTAEERAAESLARADARTAARERARAEKLQRQQEADRATIATAAQQRTVALQECANIQAAPGSKELAAVGGAVVGGLAGHQMGKGTGKKVATVAGAGLGALGGVMVVDSQVETAQSKCAAAAERTYDRTTRRATARQGAGFN